MVERKAPNSRARSSSQSKSGASRGKSVRRSSSGSTYGNSGSAKRNSSNSPRSTSSNSSQYKSNSVQPRTSSDRPRTSSDRPRTSSDRPQRSYSDRPRTSSDRPQRSSSDRPRTSSDRPQRSYSDRPQRSSSDRPRTSSDRPQRSYSDRPRTSSDRPRTSSDRPQRGERRDRPSKFDTPRRFRGDEPRRERDQRARGDAPVIDQDVTGDELGAELVQELKTLPTGLTISVAQHLVMAERYLEIDPELALIHAKHAKELAGRFPIVREIVGVTNYVNGNWQEALNDFRAVKRMGESAHLLAMMADCERGLGRPEKALEILNEAKNLTGVAKIEAAIVEAGARADLGQYEAALVALKIPALTGYPSDQTAYARLCFAYANILVKLGNDSEAKSWYQKADLADPAATEAANFLPINEETIYLDDLETEE